MFLYFNCLFINYHDVFNSCYYLLLLHKISSKTKTVITILKIYLNKWRIMMSYKKLLLKTILDITLMT